MTAATLARRSLRVAARAQRRVTEKPLGQPRGWAARCLESAAKWRREGAPAAARFGIYMSREYRRDQRCATLPA